MTLTLGFNIARSSLATNSEQTSVVSRNVAGASDRFASRKVTTVVTQFGGGVKLASVSRVPSEILFQKTLLSTSSAAAQTAYKEGLDRLNETNGDPEDEKSPSALVGKLNDALQIYSSAPHEPIRAQSAVSAAQDLANGLNAASATVQRVRTQADADIASSVTRVNSLLAEFETVNNEIIRGTLAGSDVTDYLDSRDRIISQMSEEIGVSTVSRVNNDMSIYTDSGVTLFETRPRNVAFQQTTTFLPNTTGNSVFVDGVQITGSNAGMAIDSGRLVGLVQVRDGAAVTYQNQLDEIARGLIEVFAESDQSAVPTLPDAAGLFTHAGGPAVPATGTLVVGISGTIRVNPSVNPDQGGNAYRLRDGGIAGAAYVYNTANQSGFSGRIQELADRMTEQRTFSGAAGLNTTATLSVFASNSVAYLQEERLTATNEANYRDVLLERSTDALTNIRGVNLDEELTILLDLERSYQASSRLISTIDAMYEALLAVA